jgi:hypothetical protein
MGDSCSHCGANLEAGADWCPLCYAKVRSGSSEVPSSLLQATSGPLRTPLSWIRPARRARRPMMFGGIGDVGTKVILTLGIAFGLAWTAFNLQAKFYAVAVAVGATLAWTVWRRHPA